MKIVIRTGSCLLLLGTLTAPSGGALAATKLDYGKEEAQAGTQSTGAFRIYRRTDLKRPTGLVTTERIVHGSEEAVAVGAAKKVAQGKGTKVAQGKGVGKSTATTTTTAQKTGSKQGAALLFGDDGDEAEATTTQQGAAVRKRVDPMAAMAMLRQQAALRFKENEIQQTAVRAAAPVQLPPEVAVLRELSDNDLTYLSKIPQSAIVVCGGTVPAHHLISGKIPDAGKREALRNWVKGGGDWAGAVRQVMNERGI